VCREEKYLNEIVVHTRDLEIMLILGEPNQVNQADDPSITSINEGKGILADISHFAVFYQSQPNESSYTALPNTENLLTRLGPYSS
jgi:hypothetical protein